MKAIEDRKHWTVKITNEEVDIHATDETSRIYEPRLRISLTDMQRTRQLLNLAKPLAKITEAVAVCVPKVGVVDAYRRRLRIRGKNAELPRMTQDQWTELYHEAYTEIPVSLFPAVNAKWGLLIGSDGATIGYAFRTHSGTIGVLRAELDAFG